MIGRVLGQYRITESLGAGGMGEVWRAEDTKLGREVALKLLPSAFAEDDERLARFEREAKVLASLNHPNIATLYGLETAVPASPSASAPETSGSVTGPITFLVMELVEGEGLDDRVVRGPVPVDEAVPIALQITEALEAAHDAGIVHRDLKPANIRIRPDGTVKVLDFGLAKAWDPGQDDLDLSLSPTMTRHATAAGVILGTAAYMSPEQARGKPVDRRTDIWAFGVVLWEMLTGARLFEGETVSDLVAGVLARDPDWTRLHGSATRLRPVLERCLVKDPKRRFRDIGDVRLEIERSMSEGTPDGVAAVAGSSRQGVSWGVLAAVVAAAVLATLATWFATRSAPVDRTTLRLSMTLAPNQQLATWDNAILAFSPDGSRLVTPIFQDGRQVLASRRLDGSRFEVVEGTDGGAAPFFSPDGRWLGFIADGKLVKVAAEGGRPFVLGDQQGAGGASWGADGQIVYAPLYSDGLFRVSEQGGEAGRVTTPDRERGELGHWWPQHLPGGDHVLFTAFCTPVDTSRVRVVSLATGEVRDVVDGGFFGRYVPTGHLLYVKGDRLFAAPFDVERATVTGSAVAVLDDVFGSHTGGYSMLDVSVDGTLAYSPRSVVEAPRELVWADRQGLVRPVMDERMRFNGASLAPDGRTLAISIVGDSQDLWTYSLERGTLSRMTSAARTEFSPAWAPDGRTLYYVLDEPPFAIYAIPVGASAVGEPLWDDRPDLDAVLTGVSPDGRYLAYTLTEPRTGLNLWVRRIDGSEPARAFRATEYSELFGSFSPDGRWLAYQSDETGRPEVYVEEFPGPGARFQVSADGGLEPLWVPGTGEIFYRHRGEMRVVSTSTDGATFEFGSPVTLFSLAWRPTGNNARTYDVTPDGRRVLMTQVPDAASPRRIDIVTHWLDELERIMEEAGR